MTLLAVNTHKNTRSILVIRSRCFGRDIFSSVGSPRENSLSFHTFSTSTCSATQVFLRFSSPSTWLSVGGYECVHVSHSFGTLRRVRKPFVVGNDLLIPGSRGAACFHIPQRIPLSWKIKGTSLRRRLNPCWKMWINWSTRSGECRVFV